MTGYRVFENATPDVDPSAWIDQTAVVIGQVSIGAQSSLWPQVVARGDINRITIGSRTNIQDGSILHVSHAGPHNPKGADLVIGDQVTVGHRVILHGCHVGDLCLIGMGAIVMDNVVVQPEVILGAGTLVPEGKTLESGYLYLGAPARRVRPLTPGERDYLPYAAEHYASLAERYRSS
ncbi:MAG: gamma carbonic anhydrase family protein [Pseudomonadota bacterium]